MLQKFKYIPVLFLSSIAVFTLGYLKISILTFQQITAFLVVLFLIMISRFSNLNSFKFLSLIALTNILLFSLSFFVQILILSTGALFSPFLILFHLFVLAISFLVSFEAALAFIIFSVSALIANTFLNAEQLQFVKEDVGSVLIYLVSFIVIVPLSQIIASKYHLKDELSKLLFEKVMLGESILKNLNELVVVTNTRLEIISANEAFQKILKDDADVIGKSFFDILTLKDVNGKLADIQSLSIDKVLTEKATRIISGYLLYSPRRSAPYKIIIQIRPILNMKGEIEQLSFILTEKQFGVRDTNSNLDQALNMHTERFEQLKAELAKSGQSKLNIQIDLLGQQEKDLLMAKDLEDHPINLTSELADIALICKKSALAKQAFAKDLNVTLNFRLPAEEEKETSILSLVESNYSLTTLPTSDYALPTNPKWLSLLVEKLLDIAIFLSSNSPNQDVEITPLRIGGRRIDIKISCSCTLAKKDEALLFTQYYGNLVQTTNLKLASGLEGYIAKSIAIQLNFPLAVDILPSKVLFTISLSR